MRIVQTSVSNLEFLFNFETMVKEKINPLHYRFVIEKTHKLFDKEKLYLTIKDRKENKCYDITLNDFHITKNPFLSNETFVNLMKYRVSQNSAENEEGYLVSYKRYLTTKISNQLEKIKKNQKKSKRKFSLEEIVDATSKAFKVPILQRYLKEETIESLINFIKSKNFFEMLNSSYYVDNLKRKLRSVKSLEKDLEEYSKIVKPETKAIVYPSFKKRLEFFVKDKQMVDYMARLNDKIIAKNNEEQKNS